jgi:CBS domain-containing protein
VTIARELMAELKIRHLPVVVAAELYGLISERDVSVALAAAGAHGGEVTVGQLVTKSAFVINPEARPEEVAIDMANGKHSAALAIRAGKIYGIITSTDLARVLGITLRAQRSLLERARETGWEKDGTDS